MIATFFGSPGSGKGTQAELAAEAMGLTHVSTGTQLRLEVQQGTPLGKEIRGVIEAGDLVTDDIVNRLVFGLLEELPGVLLDGYPRNALQAGDLDTFLRNRGRKLDVAVFLDIPEEEAVSRLSRRQHCTACGVQSSQADVTCGACGAGLVRRSDDDPEVIRNRFKKYRRETLPLESYYEGRLVRVDGLGTVQQVHERLLKAMSQWL